MVRGRESVCTISLSKHCARAPPQRNHRPSSISRAHRQSAIIAGLHRKARRSCDQWQGQQNRAYSQIGEGSYDPGRQNLEGQEDSHPTGANCLKSYQTFAKPKQPARSQNQLPPQTLPDIRFLWAFGEPFGPPNAISIHPIPPLSFAVPHRRVESRNLMMALTSWEQVRLRRNSATCPA